MPQALKEQRRPEPRPEQPAASNKRWIIPAAVVVAVLIVGVIVVILAGGGKSNSKNTAATTPTATASKQSAAPIPVSGAGLSLQVPGGWSKPGTPPSVPGIASPTAMGGPSGGAIVFGTADASAANPTLLSSDLQKAAGTVPSASTASLKGGAQALEYDKLGIGGGQTATMVLGIPTSNGVIDFACTASADVCATIAKSISVTGGKAFPVGPDKALEKRVSSALKTLDSKQAAAAAQLKAANKRTTQVAATRALGSAYAAAAKALGHGTLSPADKSLNASLVAALKKTGAKYSSAAGKGAKKNRAGYATDGGEAVKAHKGVTSAMGKFQAAGYSLPASVIERTSATVRLPTLKKDPKPKTHKASAPSSSTQSAPQQSTPQQSTPQQSTPQQSTPQQSSPPPVTHSAPPPATHHHSSGGSVQQGGGEG
jgi:hypothetical protein